MSEFPTFPYSLSDVRRAGKALSAGILLNEHATADISWIFRVANDWRDSHHRPMQRIRWQLISQLGRMSLRGKLTAARLKRMASIRKKLATLHLDKIQDLAGVRVILRNMKEVDDVLEACRASFPHTFNGENDYIAYPKDSGYRSHHLKFAYVPPNTEEEVFRGRRVELQVRTGRQHAWATAVETVGLFRNEDLKGGYGDPDWLRLFALMASEMAQIEDQPVLSQAPPRSDRVYELKDLNKRLGAAAFLDSINQAADFTDRYYNPQKNDFLLIRYDLQKRTVTVNGIDAVSGMRYYHATETQSDEFDTVVVAADKIGSLKAAFPNYFNDVQHFARSLRRTVQGRDSPEYILKPQEVVAPKPRNLVSNRWLRRSSRQRSRWT